MPSFDLDSNYYPHPTAGGQSGVGTGAKAQSFSGKEGKHPKTIPPGVAVKEVFSSALYNVEGSVLSKENPQALLQLKHENIVKMWSVCKTEQGSLRIVMETCAGSLDNFLKDHSFSIDGLRFVGRKIVSGLLYLHQKGIVHGDIRPQNTLLDSFCNQEQNVYLTGFGMSKYMDDTLQMASVRRTPAFMAPELIKAFVNDTERILYNGHKADAFATGVTFYKMLRRDSPFSMNDRMQSSFDLAAFFQRNEIDDESCKLLLGGLLAWDPSERISAIDANGHTFFACSNFDHPMRKIWSELQGDQSEENKQKGSKDKSTYMHVVLPRPKQTKRKPKQTKRKGAYPGLICLCCCCCLLCLKAGSSNRLRISRRPLLKFYDIKEDLGKGRFGTVCLCSRKKNHCGCTGRDRKNIPQIIAVKILKHSEPDRIHELRELRNHMELCHRNVIEMYGFEYVKGLLYILMEPAITDLVRLRTNILQIDAFLPFETSYLSYQIAEGLSYLHSNAIVHRDIKPANILASWKNRNFSPCPLLYSITLKLCDFGYSRLSPEEAMTMTTVGTLGYMAPEVAYSFASEKSLSIDYKKSDVFSAGVVFYEMLYGKRPFTFERLCKPEETQLTVNEDDSVDLVQTFKLILEWTPERRSNAFFAMHMLSKICRQKANPTDMTKRCRDDGMNPLHAAAHTGNLEELKWLIESGDEVGRTTDLGWTPLHFACQAGHLDVAKTLIKRGANVRSDSAIGMTLEGATWSSGGCAERTELIEKLTESGATPLHLACAAGHIHVARLLIDSGAEVDTGDALGVAALHWACAGGFIDVAELLLQSGASKDLKDVDGEVPLDMAKEGGKGAFMELFMRH